MLGNDCCSAAICSTTFSEIVGSNQEIAPTHLLEFHCLYYSNNLFRVSCLIAHCCLFAGSKLSISYPHLVVPHKRNDLVHHLHIEAPSLGKNFKIELVPNPDLLSTDFVFLETFANGSYPLQLFDDDAKCYYRGEKSAVSLCNGVVSIENINCSYYIFLFWIARL